MADKSAGLGIGGVVWIVLIVLKAIDAIQMNWFWVLTSFIWVDLIIVAVFFIIFAIVSFFISIGSGRW